MGPLMFISAMSGGLPASMAATNFCSRSPKVAQSVSTVTLRSLAQFCTCFSRTSLPAVTKLLKSHTRSLVELCAVAMLSSSVSPAAVPPGLTLLESMATAQSSTKLRVWLFKSFVTAGNDVLEKQVQNWAKDRKVTVETDWATFGDREPKFVAAIEAGNPPDMAEMNLYGPMRYKAALRDVSGVANQLAQAKGGLLPFAERITKVDGKFLGVPRYSMTTVFFIRRDIMEAKGLKVPKVYDPDVVEFAKKTQDPAKDLYGFGQTLNRSDDGDGFMG